MLSTQRLRRKPSGSLEASLARIAPGLKTKRILQGDAEGPGQAEESRSLETILFAHLRLKSGLPPSSRFFRKPVKHDMEGRQGWARDPETAVPAMLRGVWPEELLQDPSRRPRYVKTAEEFLSELLTGEHVEDFVILPNGTELLGLSYEDTIPEDVRLCMQDCRTAQDFVKKLLQNPEMLEKYRADVEYVDSKRQQRDTLRKDKLDLGKRIREALRMVEAGEVDAELLYVAEMRRHSVFDISKRCQRWL
eukprot:s5693_g2.t1